MSIVKFQIPFSIGLDSMALNAYVLSHFGVSSDSYRILKRSIDARSKEIKVNLELELGSSFELLSSLNYQKPTPIASSAKKVIIVGSGPAGLFAALRCLDYGLKPIVLERGDDVRLRRRALASINKDHHVPEDSNYCFGEGGAGTYSDGKLYTRAHKRGDIHRILEIFVAHGAKEEILYEAHPHIGTNKLPKIIEEMRSTILEAGGEVKFQTKVVDLELKNQTLASVIDQNGVVYTGDAFIMATGHSARDIFHLYHRYGIEIEAKPFALGVRIEHPQSVIDQIQYHCKDRDPLLPASSYSLVQQVKYKGREKGVFSFCMCPGGFIVPSATANGEIVVNGMSPSRRDSKFANSGTVVSVDAEDWNAFADKGPLAALYYQEMVEQNAFKHVLQGQTAPAQRMVDYVQNKASVKLNETSYQPGLKSSFMKEILPEPIQHRLQLALPAFGQKMKGYFSNEAQLIGIESRTSSPVKVPRNKDSCEHPQIKKMYPCGEGAGYAGGIVSAAMDGERVVNAIAIAFGLQNKQ